MATTTTYLFPYPLGTDAPDISGDIQALADRLETLFVNLPTKSGENTFSSTNTFSGTLNLTGTVTIGNVSATEIGYLDGVTSGIQGQLDLKSPLDSPIFTGIPAAPTAAADTNTTQIATTAFVIGQGYLKSSDASTTYLTQSSASSTYLTQSNAASTYLTQSNASSTYLTQSNAASTYLTQSNAASTYQPLDSDLTSIAGLSGTSGFLVTNGSGSWSIDTSTYLTSITAHASSHESGGTDEIRGALTYTTLTASTSITTSNTAYGLNRMNFVNHSATTSLTLPSDSTSNFNIGSQLHFMVTSNNAATVSFVAGSGATLNAQGDKKTMNGQGSVATAVKTASNTWYVFGNLI